jgi:hypothetical protein
LIPNCIIRDMSGAQVAIAAVDFERSNDGWTGTLLGFDPDTPLSSQVQYRVETSDGRELKIRLTETPARHSVKAEFVGIGPAPTDA